MKRPLFVKKWLFLTKSFYASSKWILRDRQYLCVKTVKIYKVKIHLGQKFTDIFLSNKREFVTTVIGVWLCVFSLLSYYNKKLEGSFITLSNGDIGENQYNPNRLNIVVFNIKKQSFKYLKNLALNKIISVFLQIFSQKYFWNCCEYCLLAIFLKFWTTYVL